MPLSISLEPNKLLQQSEFEGYKLNLRDLSHFSHELEKPVDRVFIDGVHANIFGPHNHLNTDPWDNGYSYYYIDKTHRVHHIAFDGRFTFQDRIVYEVPTQTQREPGVCLSFADHNIAVISDATGNLFIIDTGNRTKYPGGQKTWVTVHTSSPLGENKSIVVVDCKIQEAGMIELLHCLVQSVERRDIIYNSVISWIVYEKKYDSNSWNQVSNVDLKGKGKVYYAALESNCDALYLASDSPVKITKITTLQQNEYSSNILQGLDNNDNNQWNPKCEAGEVKINFGLPKDCATKEDKNLEETSAFVRLDAKTLQITHTIPLSNHQYLFSLKLENNEAPAVALRHDMNACVWQPYKRLVDSEMWPVKHQGTLMAFGYLQSAKHNRKFVTCSPNLAYGVMCDGKRHIFIYESDNNPICKMSMKRTQLEQEHIFNMDDYGEVLGIYASNNYLFVLTQTNFIAIKIS